MSQNQKTVYFDGVIGPTHNFSGLSIGNVASIENKNTQSNPKAAALEGLEKMKILLDNGIPQAVIPPHERPHLPTLRSLGFSGNDEDVLKNAVNKMPDLIPQLSSAACMFLANSATVTPSSDTLDNKLHFTPANLITKLHRAIEAPFTYKLLSRIFQNPNFFTVHKPLPSFKQFSDEGAANHIRFTHPHAGTGLHLFVYGFSAFKGLALSPIRYPARQSLEASQCIVQRHSIQEDTVLYAQQNPRAIDAGVFHNDVISLGNENFFFYHEESFIASDTILNQLRANIQKYLNKSLIEYKVTSAQVSLKDAISTYLFNSQLLSLADGHMLMLAPKQCQDNPQVSKLLEEMLKLPDIPINNILFVDLSESMRNGGGPSCLKLNVPMQSIEYDAMHQGIIFNDIRYKQIKSWIEKHYRDKLFPSDIADPFFMLETQTALDELTVILKLGSIYSFQK